MKAPLEFDPRDHYYGPGTKSVRSLLATWADIDWFEATATSDSDMVEIFRDHNARARAASPERFSERVEIEVVHGQWPEFEAWCDRVRKQDWSWKYSALKELARDHSSALGLGWEAWSKSMPPGGLVHRFRDARDVAHVAWRSLFPYPANRGGQSEFYLLYAHGDLLDAIQWQLAEGHDDRSNNPFDALLSCYHAGAYPFSLDRAMVVLFRWSSTDSEPARSRPPT